MATSGTYSFGVTRDDIIRQALLNIGKLDPYESPDPQQTQDCAIVLNAMVKQWMGKADFATGLKVWTRKHGHLFLSSTTGRYLIGPGATGWSNDIVFPVTTAAAAAGATVLTLSSVVGIAAAYFIGIQIGNNALQWTTVVSVNSGLSQVTILAPLTVQANSGAQIFAYQTTAQQPLFIETAILRDQALTDTPMRMLTVQDYDNLPNKADPTNIQDPTAIYYENQLTNSYLYTDAGAAQDVTKHLVMSYQEPVQDFNNPTDNPYYPQEWYAALFNGLGKRVCPIFNRPWTPLHEENFKEALAIARNKDAERSSLFFQPGAED